MSSLKLVLGRAGSGKSEYIKEQAVKTHMLSKNAIIIVPEQYSHEYEMQMIKKTGYICESLNVTSFNRLANRVILNSGLTRRCTDNSGRAMLLCRALLRCSKKLVYFKKAQEKTGYINGNLDFEATVTSETRRYGGCRSNSALPRSVCRLRYGKIF